MTASAVISRTLKAGIARPTGLVSNKADGRQCARFYRGRLNKGGPTVNRGLTRKKIARHTREGGPHEEERPSRR